MSILRTIIVSLIFNCAFAHAATLSSSQAQDAQFREKVVGQAQVAIEKKLIAARNGVFVLFTPTHGTPQMISESGEIPEGLIPQERMRSFEKTIKPRVFTTHQMPAANIRCILIRAQKHRPQAQNASKFVDEKYYKQLLAQYPNHIVEKLISTKIFESYQTQGMPAAFYYALINGKPYYAAIFGKQINATPGNKLTDPGVFEMRAEDLEIVNTLLHQLGLRSVEDSV